MTATAQATRHYIWCDGSCEPAGDGLGHVHRGVVASLTGRSALDEIHVSVSRFRLEDREDPATIGLRVESDHMDGWADLTRDEAVAVAQMLLAAAAGLKDETSAAGAA